MNAVIIAIGDELLIGQTINSNAAWIGQGLSLRGFDIQQSLVVKDNEEAIKKAILNAFQLADLVIVTGGLGPTKDDITKKVLVDLFNTKLVINEEVLARVRAFFDKYKREMLDVNIQQAALPESATVLVNHVGTASGMWFDHDGKVLISLPGVPYEMKNILETGAFEKLSMHFQANALSYKTFYLQGIGESYIADRISDIEDEIKSLGLSLAYLPSPGLVRLRISGRKNVETERLIDQFVREISERLPMYAYSGFNGSLNELIGDLLRKESKTIGTVESCTGGALASDIVRVPGASDYFKGGFLTYTNEIKSKIVAVNPKSLSTFGPVSKEVVAEMALNGRKMLGIDICISISGIAGPNGGDDANPVGTVWIGIADSEGVYTKKFLLGNDRNRTIDKAVLSAENLLRCRLLKINIEKD